MNRLRVTKKNSNTCYTRLFKSPEPISLILAVLIVDAEYFRTTEMPKRNSCARLSISSLIYANLRIWNPTRVWSYYPSTVYNG